MADKARRSLYFDVIFLLNLDTYCYESTIILFVSTLISYRVIMPRLEILSLVPYKHFFHSLSLLWKHG